MDLNNDSILNVTSYVESLNDEVKYEDSIEVSKSLETKEDAVILYLFWKLINNGRVQKHSRTIKKSL